MVVPARVYYGASTQRAVLNFPVSGRSVSPEIIRALLLIKRIAAEVNVDLGKLDKYRGRLIRQACSVALSTFDGEATRLNPRPVEGEEIAAAMAHFPVDVFQTGSGTSTNMNVNEVISNLACVHAGRKIGAKNPVHPNDHVNMGQSSNDVFPTAMQVAAAVVIRRSLIPALKRLARTLATRSRQWKKIVTVGRTHLMDATPITIGQEFSGFASQAEHAVARAERALEILSTSLPVGGTAVGTGTGTHAKFGRLVAAELSKETRVRFRETGNHFEAQSTRDGVVAASGEMRTIAISFSKIANDIRLLGSGPRCGFFELLLPAIQPGSSIMPGKVNPVICESMVQIACQVIGNDAAIAVGGLGGVGSILQLNVAMPMIAENLLSSINLLANGSSMFVDSCLDGLKVNRAVVDDLIEQSLMLCTGLVGDIGYDAAAQVAQEAYRTGLTVREYMLEHQLMDAGTLSKHLDVLAMTRPDA